MFFTHESRTAAPALRLPQPCLGAKVQRKNEKGNMDSYIFAFPCFDCIFNDVRSARIRVKIKKCLHCLHSKLTNWKTVSY